MKTLHIHIEGQVQGVGFRPFVYKKAAVFKIQGWVNNGVDGVHIRFNSTSSESKDFCRQIINEAPELSRILRYSMTEVDSEVFESFDIVDSKESGEPNLLITPDFALCSDCEQEIISKENRRYQYPFTTCTNCGPRYSIITSLPYDRYRTSMRKYDMCAECHSEYIDPTDRRHFSQTNSCEVCGISMQLEDQRGKVISGNNDQLINEVCELLLKGNIVAVKGIGGYLLLTDATNAKVIERLRKRKNRPTKPFALMYPDINSIKRDVYLSSNESEILYGVESPILLLKYRDEPGTGIAVKSIAPGLDEIGIMRPYTPLFSLILNKVRRPLIATSGNTSGSPVVFTNKQARELLSGISDYILSNDRGIVIPQDDSVEKVLEDNERLIIRRSRGYAPTYIHKAFNNHHVQDMMAMGAMLKSTFAITHKGNTYISQYLGDLESYDTQLSYDLTIDHFLKLFQPKFNRILVDMHPQYYSTLKGIERGNELGIQVDEIQHHESHLMSVITENSLIDINERILGVIWDGTGLGIDGQIWGGEYFIYNKNNINRIDHLPYFDHILGDKFAKDTRLPALSLCKKYCLNTQTLESRFSNDEWELYNKILEKGSSLKTSSMGRIFDAISNLIEITPFNTFEGEAAMHLQAYAERFVRENGMIDNTFISLSGGIDQCCNELMIGANAKVNKEKLAYDFIHWLVHQVKQQAENQNVEKIVFSGGVFQNSLLLHLLKKKLSSEFELYFNKRLSPNDENISFGQLAYSYAGITSTYQIKEKIQEMTLTT